MNMEIGFIGEQRGARSQARIENIRRMVQEINQAPVMLNRRVQLRVDDAIGRVIIKIIDPATDTVIKEMPPAQLQRMYRNIRKQMDMISR